VYTAPGGASARSAVLIRTDVLFQIVCAEAAGSESLEVQVFVPLFVQKSTALTTVGGRLRQFRRHLQCPLSVLVQREGLRERRFIQYCLVYGTA
jgi:hypothetical protein